jgi:hypothetical protein
VAGILVAIWGAMRITGWPEIALEPKLIDVATDNLTSLHKHEEQLRARSVAAIEANATLSDHWNLVAEAMNAIYAFADDHDHGSERHCSISVSG